MLPESARSVKELIEICAQGAEPKFVFFWGDKPPRNDVVTKHCFSQWYAAGFTVDGIEYKTAEHFMMASKAKLFNDTTAYNKALAATTPRKAKAIGREVKNFDEKTWVSKRFEIVVQASYEKFKQNPKLCEFLLGTEKRVLVEASPKDKIWGIGLAEADKRAMLPEQWQGLNLLGFALMEARNLLL